MSTPENDLPRKRANNSRISRRRKNGAVRTRRWRQRMQAFDKALAAGHPAAMEAKRLERWWSDTELNDLVAMLQPLPKAEQEPYRDQYFALKGSTDSRREARRQAFEAARAAAIEAGSQLP